MGGALEMTVGQSSVDRASSGTTTPSSLETRRRWESLFPWELLAMRSSVSSSMSIDLRQSAGSVPLPPLRERCGHQRDLPTGCQPSPEEMTTERRGTNNQLKPSII